ncbi:MAG: hypothetical protein ACX939_13840, partial [Hyphococcus sp.]
MTSNPSGSSMQKALPMPDLSASAKQQNGGLREGFISPNGLSPAQKAALVIAALGPDAAGPIIERIDQKHLKAFAKAYSHLQTIPKSALKTVIEEFMSNLGGGEEEIQGGVAQTRALLGQFVGDDDVVNLMEGIKAPGGETVWQRIDRADDGALADYLAKQNPQLVAVVLARIDPDKASRILDIF